MILRVLFMIVYEKFQVPLPEGSLLLDCLVSAGESTSEGYVHEISLASSDGGPIPDREYSCLRCT